MTSLPGFIAVALVFLVASVIALPEHAGADVQYFPIPAVSTSKNDGNDAGLIKAQRWGGNRGVVVHPSG